MELGHRRRAPVIQKQRRQVARNIANVGFHLIKAGDHEIGAVIDIDEVGLDFLRVEVFYEEEYRVVYFCRSLV